MLTNDFIWNIFTIRKVRKGILIKMKNIETLNKKSALDGTIKCGYYYLPREVCKNIIIAEGLSGDQSSQAVKKIKSSIICSKGEMVKSIPNLESIDQEIISFYAGELAESLVKAAGNGKGLEIAIGYPKIFVIFIN